MKSLRIIAFALAILALSGCVERRLLIVTNVKDTPVELYLDGESVGEAPSTVIFESYGARDYRARAAGYQTSSGRVELETPWYEWPILDFFSEVLIPWTIVDEHKVEITLHELSEHSTHGLNERAKAFREEAIREANKPKLIGDERTLKKPLKKAKQDD